MKTIKHYQLAIEPIQQIEIPFQCEILGVIQISKHPFLAVLVHDESGRNTKKFAIIAAGKEVAVQYNSTNYVGSFDYFGEDMGVNVLHVFEDRT